MGVYFTGVALCKHLSVAYALWLRSDRCQQEDHLHSHLSLKLQKETLDVGNDGRETEDC